MSAKPSAPRFFCRGCMDASIAAILLQDGITSGAIYALLALSLVLVFSVTRVILIPAGEFVSYGALTLAALQTRTLPGTCWLLLALGVCCFIAETVRVLRHAGERRHAWRTLPVLAGRYLLFPVAVLGLTQSLVTDYGAALPLVLQVALAMLIVTPMGPMIYRLAFEPLV